MSKQHIEDCIRLSLDEYFRDLRGAEPDRLHELMMTTVEKPLLQVVMERCQNNQSQAAQWLGINRNTLRRKLVDHNLVK